LSRDAFQNLDWVFRRDVRVEQLDHEFLDQVVRDIPLQPGLYCVDERGFLAHSEITLEPNMERLVRGNVLEKREVCEIGNRWREWLILVVMRQFGREEVHQVMDRHA
jgi:hypothetical protein